jgi:hypothetical protein
MTARPFPLPIALLAAAVLFAPAGALADDGAPEASRGAPASALASPGLERPAPFGHGEVPTEEGAWLAGRFRPGELTLPIGETLAVHFAMMGWNRYVGDARWATVDLDSIGANLRSGWVLDDNAFFVNQVGHPYQGTWAFTAARSTGFGFWGAAPFAFGASALWELAGETKRPALNDQVTTTVAGMVLGEIAHRFAGALRAEGGGWRVALASIVSPMGALNAGALGYSDPLVAPPSRWQLSLGSVAVEGMGSARGAWQPLAYTGFAFTWGIPGSPGLTLERPFDHFVLEAGYGMAQDPVATVRARGLVAGAPFALDPVRGLFGLYLSFDLDTPPRHQLSTSAVGFGGSARTELGGGLSVEGDAILSGILLGAGSRVDRGADAGDRDYRFGPGEQALLGLRLVAGSRGTLGVALRQYLLAGAGADAGSTELLLEGSASAVVRLTGPHGIGVEAGRLGRWASAPGTADVSQVDSVFRVYYTLLGGTPRAEGRGASPSLLAAEP